MNRRIFTTLVGSVLAGVALPGRRVRADTPPPPEQGPPDEPPIVTVPVAGDRDVEAVLGPAGSGATLLYMHGVCGDPLAFRSWAGAARRHATLVSLRGDEPCKGRTRTKWSWNFARLDRRIQAAVAAVGAHRGAPLDQSRVAVLGYSQGALRAEWLAYHFPERYGRVALIGSAQEPRVETLKRAEAVLLMAGARDAKRHIADAARKLEQAGKRVRYAELPGARHGEYGPEAMRVMATELAWLFKKVP